jgi:hypothetical protein
MPTLIIPSLSDLTKQVELHTDLASLNHAMALHSGRYAWWAMHEVHARHRVRELERAMGEHERTVKELEAKLYLRHKSQRDGDASNKPTVEQLKAAVASDSERMAAEALRNQLQAQIDTSTYEAEQLKVGRETIRGMRDMLMEIARNIREELGAGMTPRVREHDGGVAEIAAHTPNVERARAKAAEQLAARRSRKPV